MCLLILRSLAVKPGLSERVFAVLKHLQGAHELLS
jgi:hypothetical protein